MENTDLSPLPSRPPRPGGRAWGGTTFALVAVAIFGAAVFGGRLMRGMVDGQPRVSMPRESTTSMVTASVADNRPLDTTARGRVIYLANCAKCHGPEGRGDGDPQPNMLSPPRDFASRPWRFAVDRDSIARVVREGIPGTAMPSAAAALSDDDINMVAEHVHTLATRPLSEPATRDLEAERFALAGFARVSPRVAAPPLAVVGIDERTNTLERYSGKVVLLNFWGVSCAHCLAHMPRLDELAERHADRGLVVLSVCADEDDLAIATDALAAAGAATERAHVDRTGLATARYEVGVLPTVYLIDRAGRVVARSTGAQDWVSAPHAAMIEALLAE